VRPSFTYTDFDCYVSATFYVIKTERINQKYLTGLLNSSLTAFWLKNKGKMQGNNYQVDKEPIIDLPIIKASQDEQKVIISIVEKIIEIIGSGNYLESTEKQEKVRGLEGQIDEMVMDLYGLTQEEREIVRRA
jgi:adenine-specific DNA-methyltransferase